MFLLGINEPLPDITAEVRVGQAGRGLLNSQPVTASLLKLIQSIRNRILGYISSIIESHGQSWMDSCPMKRAYPVNADTHYM